MDQGDYAPTADVGTPELNVDSATARMLLALRRSALSSALGASASVPSGERFR